VIILKRLLNVQKSLTLAYIVDSSSSASNLLANLMYLLFDCFNVTLLSSDILRLIDRITLAPILFVMI